MLGLGLEFSSSTPALLQVKKAPRRSFHGSAEDRRQDRSAGKRGEIKNNASTKSLVGGSLDSEHLEQGHWAEHQYRWPRKENAVVYSKDLIFEHGDARMDTSNDLLQRRMVRLITAQQYIYIIKI